MERQIAVLSSRGQLTLPASLRRRLRLSKGDKVNVYDVNNQYLLIEKIDETPLETILGRFESSAKEKRLKPEDLEKELRKVRKDLFEELYGKEA